MAARFAHVQYKSRKDYSPVAAVAAMLATILVAVLLLVLNSDLAKTFPYLFLLPWIFALALVLLAPSAYLLYKGKFNFENPVVFASFSYFIPAFVVGGIMLATGFSRPYFLSFIQDPAVNLPYTVALIGLGFAGLAAGYFLPLGTYLGKRVGNLLPKTEPHYSKFVWPGIVLLFLGIINTVIATVGGIIGYQKAEAIGTYDGLIFLTTLFWIQGSFILWYIIFRGEHFTARSYLLMAVLSAVALIKALFAGNRGSLLSIAIMIGLAYLLSGRRLDFKRTIWAAILVSLALVVGMVYGTTFRENKGSEAAVSIDRYAENVATTLEQVGSGGNLQTLEFGLTNLAERIDTVSSVAVVVSTYEELAPYEESYGLDNNIWKDTTSFFIPRVVWADKPVASDPRAYSDLYFSYGENSFAITPIADLLRNYGVYGVFIGMLILGLFLRTLYRSLIDEQPRMLWRATLYFMLLNSISYESFYGSILPLLVKVGITAVAGLIIVFFIVRLMPDSDRRTRLFA